MGDGPTGIAVGGGGVWLTNNVDGTVSRINAQSNTELRRITVGAGPTAIAYGFGSVWVANSADRTLTRIDPRTGDVRQDHPDERSRSRGRCRRRLRLGDGRSERESSSRSIRVSNKVDRDV